MIPKTRRALLVASTLVALAVATFAFAAWQRSSLPDDPPVDRGGSGLSTGRSGGSSGKGSGAAPSAAAWKEIDQLIKEQKFAAAIEKATALREALAREEREPEWARAIVLETQLGIALGGYETAVEKLRALAWPQGALHRATLELYYAHALVDYLDAYSWEIQQRERTVSAKALDLKAWTRDQIAAEATKAYTAVWELREKLGKERVREFEYLERGGYPEEIRGTLRDAVTYLFVELLANTSLWRPEQANEKFLLDLPALIRGEAAGAVDLVDPETHPLRKVGALLSDLEAWHAGREEPGAALEARLERARRLHEAFDQAEDRTAIRSDLEQRLPDFRGDPWWSQGMATLAEMVREEESPNHLVRARKLAAAGERAYPDSLGGRHCRRIAAEIEAPEFNLAGMASDAANRRSLQLTHRNLEQLYFRAYAVDLPARLTGTIFEWFVPRGQEVEKVIDGARPTASWTAELPATPDFEEHRTFLTPPIAKAGLYLVVASARPEFSREANKLESVAFFVSDLVLLTEVDPGRELRAQVVSGASGKPLAEVEVTLFRYDWRKPAQRVARATTAADGTVDFPIVEEQWGNYFLYARLGADYIADQQWLHGRRGEEPEVQTSALVFTDRALYRPQQKLLWKVLVYTGRPRRGEWKLAPGSSLTVELVDPNHEVVANAAVTTNSFGTVSGEFAIPAGRLLGAWTLRTTQGGAAPVRVEEYKRPTFEVTLADPPSGLRLNREARLKGEARYYFGLPVTAGKAGWRVTRQPLYPWWWRYCFWWRPTPETPQRIASGTSPLAADGSFELTFTAKADEREAASGVNFRYRVEAEVTDEGGETRGAERSFNLGWVTVAAEITAERAFFRAGEEALLTVGRHDLNGVVRPGKGSYRLVALSQPERTLLPAEQPLGLPRRSEEIEEERYETPGDRLRPRWDTALSAELILASWEDGRELARGEVTHDASGNGEVRLPELAAGAYRLRYETLDDFGAKATAEKEFLVVSERTPVALPLVLLAAERTRQPGESLNLFVHSGVRGQEIFLDTFRQGRAIARRRLVAGRYGELIEIPITAADRGGFIVRATAVADHQLMSTTVYVAVPWEEKRLAVEFATFRDRLRPGTKESWRLKVKDAKGRPVEAGAAELLAAMYDRSLDYFAPHSVADIVNIYPSGGWASPQDSTLGQAERPWGWQDDWTHLPAGIFLQPHYLKFLDSYGIGGPGGGGSIGFRQRMSMKAEGRVMALPAAPAAAMEEAKANEVAADTAAIAEPEKQAAPEPVEIPAEALRTNFAETAFFEPHLLTGADGTAAVEFTVPDSVTSWKVWVSAVTRDLRGGYAEREAKSVKELMVRPYLPRFLREGDRAELKVVVNNASEETLSGRLTLEIFDPETSATLLPEFGLDATHATQPFTVAAGGGTNLTFSLTAPQRVGPVAVKVVAAAGEFSDGELRPLPLLPARMHLAQSRFVTLRDRDRRELDFADLRRPDPTRINEQLVVTLDAQLFYSVLEALPYLVDYPYECTEQTMNRFLATGIVSSLFEKYPAVARMAQELSKRDTRLERWDAPDPNRKLALEETPWLRSARGGTEVDQSLIRVLDPRIAKAQREEALAKLQKAQLPSGAFPWFPGGPPSEYMTLYLMYGFAKAAEFEVEVPREMVQKGWAYLAEKFRQEWRRHLKEETGWEFLTFLNYVASSYPDPSWMGDALTAEERREILDLSFRHWQKHSPMLKLQLAMTLTRMGRPADAKLVFASVMDSSKTTRDEGTFWNPEDRAWLWYNDTIETHAQALRAMLEVVPEDRRADGLVQWLFLNKKLNHWKSTRATSEVLYSLAVFLDREGTLAAREEATVSVAHQKTTFTFEPDRYTGKKNQIVVPGEKIDSTSEPTVLVEKETPGLLFASATWHFSTEELPAEARGDLFRVERRYFKRVQEGRETTLEPLTEGAVLKPGDEVEIQLSLASRAQAEYVHLRDPRPAGLEPDRNLSGYNFDLGLAYYQETRDSGANFFFEWLPAGEYTFRYRLRANLAGTFRSGPATVQSMYAPEFVAYSAGQRLTIAAE